MNLNPRRRVGTYTVVTFLTLVPSFTWQAQESARCQSDIVSSTVVATFCGHRDGDTEKLDLLIIWRGSPGWFQRKGAGGGGSGGRDRFGAGTKGVVSRWQSYGDVTIRFDVDFDTQVARIGSFTIELDRRNTIVVDGVDAEWRITATRWTDPVLPLNGDWNLALARQSGEVVRDLRCDVQMPRSSLPQVPVITVCDKLKKH